MDGKCIKELHENVTNQTIYLKIEPDIEELNIYVKACNDYFHLIERKDATIEEIYNKALGIINSLYDYEITRFLRNFALSVADIADILEALKNKIVAGD